MTRGLLLFICSTIFPILLIAQNDGYVPQQFLVQIQKNASIQELQTKLNLYNPNLKWETPQQIIPNMPFWQLNYQGQADDEKILAFIQQLHAVHEAQFNHYIHFRDDAPNATTPNDPLFSNQWQYINTGTGGGTVGMDLDADLAWDVTTGGLTALNDTIVVAVIDDGISLTHADLTPNRWFNHAEIPNNGIDDDNNGYVDDYQGWNTTTQTDYITGGSHGSQVAGIIGAQGDNATGVTGVNWNVKMMVIRSDFNTTESVVLAAYGYALTQRKIYNQTNGQKGAYVVVTNASWGRDNAQASSAPLWCAFYDSLGTNGILNVGATANANVDVDIVGDLPTTCPSDYLVAVTNINKQGQKAIAAYGATHIDLGAFGEGVYTTKLPNTYGLFGGTSAATPHVSGAIALLYAGACSNFMTYSRVHPDSAALKIKDYIMNGTVANIDLAGRTVSEGHLNLNNSMNLCVNDCPSNACFAPYNIFTTLLTDTLVEIDWTAANTVQQLQVKYKIQGTTNWDSTLVVYAGQQIMLPNLSPCTDYEVELTAVCNSNLGESTLFSFQTDGCCEPPTGLALYSPDDDSTQINWNAVLAANSYQIKYKEHNTTTWLSTTVVDTTVWLTGLQPCTYYDVAVKTVCANGITTSRSDTLTFLTLGCVSCTAVNYCTVSGQNSNDDWIEAFSIDTMLNISGNNGGYKLFDSIPPIVLGKGDYHNISISQGQNFVEFATIWLDINQDGDFSDPDETIFNTIFSTLDTTKNGSIIVPPSALLGVTRMRVALRWNRLPLNCGTYDYGEVEDYCVEIIAGNSIQKLPSDINQVQVYPNPFGELLNIKIDLKKSSNIAFTLYSTTGQLIHTQNKKLVAAGQHNFSLNTTIPTGIYFLKIKTSNGQIVRRVIKN